MMVKIAYIAFLDISSENGVLKKIKDQVELWIENNHNNVHLYIISPEDNKWEGVADLEINIYSLKHFGRIRGIKALVKDVLQWSPDIVYMRYGTFYLETLKLMRKIPTVIEINTINRYEEKIMLPFYKRLYHYLTRPIEIMYSRGLIFVTNEIAEQYKNNGKHSTVITNGILFNRFEQKPPTDNINPRLIFLGSSKYPWHGVDKIIIMAKVFPDWNFDLVGPNLLSVDCDNLPQNIIVHGQLGYEQYMCLLRKADIAIGSLALHRKRMNEACPIKVREYLANGLPTIIGYLDVDFLDNPPYILQIPNTEDNIITSLKEIEEFVLKWKNKRINRSDIPSIDMKNKEKQRLEFFAKVLSG